MDLCMEFTDPKPIPKSDIMSPFHSIQELKTTTLTKGKTQLLHQFCPIFTKTNGKIEAFDLQ